MNNINPASNSGQLSNYKKKGEPANRIKNVELKRTDDVRRTELEKTKRDAKVAIPDAVKDFSRIKKAVDTAPEIDKSEKIAKLKEQIAAGNYDFNYEAIADKMLKTDF
ncbi:MAG: flagellar biosynthesis anti-sigma factor FlgM [Bacteriovoracaceae bacterium]|nr:flagellar biosynthesis anti-sigma factor FlgM [Bacteriovoracaceae bacterium]